MPYLTKPIAPRGALIDVLVGLNEVAVRLVRHANKPVPQAIKLEALIDTGAVVTCIDPEAIQSLCLIPTSSIEILVPHPSAIPLLCPQYDVTLTILHPVKPQFNLILSTVTITGADVWATGADTLIGCDLLRKWQFLFDGRAGTFTLDY